MCVFVPQVGWKRCSELSSQPGLFLDDEEDESGDGGAEANDIIQGTLGDCYFLSSLAILCTSKGLGLVEKLFVSQVRSEAVEVVDEGTKCTQIPSICRR